jgi:hypothetical protein
MMGAVDPHVSPVAARSPDTVMRLARMGAAHPTRLSFLRTLLRRAETERWQISRPVWNIGADGFGHAVYQVDMPASTVSLVAFSTYLAPENRTDRVIAEAWDSSYVLYDGVPDAAEIERLGNVAPRQEAARYTARDLTLSRANKSVRLFDHVVDALAAGRQPDRNLVDKVGYLMRTTAVYGNGKFGIADRELVTAHPALRGPFQAEMLTVWLIRCFTVDLVEHCARAKSPTTAVRLDRNTRRGLGVGNATGLGMAPFLVKHPTLIHRWVAARETALARVRSIEIADDKEWMAFCDALKAAQRLVAVWTTDEPAQAGRTKVLGDDLIALDAHAQRLVTNSRTRLWDTIWRWASTNLSLEGQEMTLALLLEPHGELIDDLAATMAADEDVTFRIDGRMTCAALRGLIEAKAHWAMPLDLTRRTAQARFWYVSEEKLEPRLGERFEEPGAELEMPLATARDLQALSSALADTPANTLVATFLLAHPEHRHTVRRLQQTIAAPYGDIRDNLIDAAMRPIDLLRLKLAFFGANRFDPRSDRWLRITLFRDAPFPDELATALR